MTTVFRRFTFWLALVGLVALVLFVRANTGIPPMPQPLATPPEKPYTKGIGASGIIECLEENTKIGVPFSALVTAVNVTVWQKVQKGDLLFQLDDRDLRGQLTSQKADLAVRDAERARVKRKRDRFAEMFAGASVSREEMETVEDDLEIAEAYLAKATAAIAETELKLARYRVVAPIDATILQVNIRAGEQVSPGVGLSPMVLGNIEQLQVRADVDEQLASRVRPGAKAIAYRKGESNEAIPLRFVRIEPYIIPKQSLTGASSERVDTRVLPVIFTLVNTATTATYVGQQVDVFIEE